MAQTQAELDKLDCREPGCTHTDHSIIHFHAKCHKRRGVKALFHPEKGTVDFSCAECGKFIVDVQLQLPLDRSELRCPVCHPSYGVNVAYVKATGSLDVSCKRCKNPLCSLAVMSRQVH